MGHRFWAGLLFSFLFSFSVESEDHKILRAKKVWKDEEETAEYWINLAREELENAIRLQDLNKNVANNVIIFLGDGMSIPTVTASRILKGQSKGENGEESSLAMDKFPHIGLSKTYAVDKQVADSASTATAILCGVKGKYYTVGLAGGAMMANCSSVEGNEVDSVLVDAYKAGKSTGIITTTRLNHATPAGAYAHSAYRKWYSDHDLSAEAIQGGCKDIAQQFYDNSHMITVAMGGGRLFFKPSGTNDTEYPYLPNQRLDGQDLIENWIQDQRENGLSASYVWNKSEFDKVDPRKIDRLLGLFEPVDMNFEVDREDDGAGEPSISEMTEKAISILQKNPKGYFLLVEGGKIDHAHHANNAMRALHDTVALDDAIARAVEMTSDEDTLIVVTADHSHTFNFGGYTDRGQPILGLSVTNGQINKGTDDKPYTSLLYGNGVAYQGTEVNSSISSIYRQNLTGTNTGDKEFRQQSAVPTEKESHGGDDVTIMARGPMAHLFHGVHEQSYIAYVMRYVSCVGDDTRHCKKQEDKSYLYAASFIGTNVNASSATILMNALFFLLVFLIALSVAMGYTMVTHPKWHPKKRKKSQRKNLLEKKTSEA